MLYLQPHLLGADWVDVEADTIDGDEDEEGGPELAQADLRRLVVLG